MVDSIFGLSEKALNLAESRSVLLTNNIANSSTPHYKAQDIDFQKALRDADQKMSGLAQTSQGHIQTADSMSGANVQYRVPMQTSMDGNTVDEEIERKNFIQNSLHYQVNLTFVQNKSDELLRAIKGE